MVEDEGGDVDGGRGRHLCRLAELGALDSISIVASDFYGHLAFRYVSEGCVNNHLIIHDLGRGFNAAAPSFKTP